MNKKFMILSIAVALLVVATITLSSYAYFTISNKEGEESVITSGTMSLLFTDGNEISANNLLPGQYIEKEFTVKNNGNVDTSYDVYLSEVINTFADKTDLVYELTSTDGGYNTTSQTQVPSTSSKIVSNQAISVGDTHHYKLKITFLSKDENQDDNQGKVFSATIQINEYNDITAKVNYYYKNSLVSEIPTINAEFISGSCDKGANIIFDSTNWVYEVENISDKNTTCNLYFADPSSRTLAMIQEKNSDITVSTNNPSFSNVDTTVNSLLYKSTDDYGDTYYFRGAVTSNYLTFAGYCWRIIRINGDGSLRLLYDGSTCHDNGTITTDNIIANNQNYSVNGVDGHPKYMGYMNGELDSVTKLYANTNNSNVKNVIDNWYNNTLVPAIGTTKINDYLADMYFCNDRSFYNGNGVSGDIMYSGYRRINEYYDPKFNCPQSNDLFTNSTSSKGNKMLGTVKAGMITADEVDFAGGMVGMVNKNYFIYNGNDIWTVTPWSYSGSYGVGSIFYVRNNDVGQLAYKQPVERAGIRPVINIKGSVISSGTGVLSDPFNVVIE